MYTKFMSYLGNLLLHIDSKTYIHKIIYIGDTIWFENRLLVTIDILDVSLILIAQLNNAIVM